MIFRLIFPRTATTLKLASDYGLSFIQMTYQKPADDDDDDIVVSILGVEVQRDDGGMLPIDWHTAAMCIYDVTDPAAPRPVKYDPFVIGDVDVATFRDMLLNASMQRNIQSAKNIEHSPLSAGSILLVFSGDAQRNRALAYMQPSAEDSASFMSCAKCVSIDGPVSDKINLFMLRVDEVEPRQIPLYVRQVASIVWEMKGEHLHEPYKVAPQFANLGFSYDMLDELLTPHLASMGLYTGSLERKRG